MSDKKNNIPEKIWIPKHDLPIKTETNHGFISTKNVFNQTIEYVLKSTADEQKSNTVTRACHNALQEEKDGLLKLVKARDKQLKEKEDWFDAIIKSAYEVHKERIEEILKPVRDAWESKSGLGQFEKEGAIMPISLPFKTILLLLAKGRRAIKKTLELADNRRPRRTGLKGSMGYLIEKSNS